MISPINIAHRWVDSQLNSSVFDRVIAAEKAGADMIECDVRQTQDGKFVISHDAKFGQLPDKIECLMSNTLQSMTGQRNYSNLSLAALFEAISTTGLMLDLEVKSDHLNLDQLHSITPSSLRERVVISSFYPRVLQNADSLFRERWLITSLSYRRTPAHLIIAAMPLKAAHSVKATGIVPYKFLATERLIERAKKEGIKIVPWTVNRDDELMAFLGLDVWGIVTDEPAKLSNLKKGG